MGSTVDRGVHDRVRGRSAWRTPSRPCGLAGDPNLEPERARKLAQVAALYAQIVGEHDWLSTMERRTGFSRETILVSCARRDRPES